MEQNYDVMYASRSVGTVSVRKEGLYYKIHCRVEIPGQRIFVQTNEDTVDLGICIPYRGEYGFHICKSIKSIPGSIEKFYLGERKQKSVGCQIDPSQPFSYLQNLTEGKLVIENGNYYWISNQPSHTV